MNLISTDGSDYCLLSSKGKRHPSILQKNFRKVLLFHLFLNFLQNFSKFPEAKEYEPFEIEINYAPAGHI